MDTLLAFFLGLAAAAGGTLFPGMLNMTAVSTSLRAGPRAGYRFAAGLATTFMTQAGVGVFFSRYLASNPLIIEGMKQWAIVIFVVLAVFFFVKGTQARHQRVGRPYHGSPYLRGALMAFLNFLTLPYFFVLGGWLISDGYLAVNLVDKLGFALGAGAGAMAIFGSYAHLAEWIRQNAAGLTRNINFILGGLFVVLTLIQSARLYWA